MPHRRGTYLALASLLGACGSASGPETSASPPDAGPGPAITNARLDQVFSGATKDQFDSFAKGDGFFDLPFKGFHGWDSTPGVGPPAAAADLIAGADGGPHSLGPMTAFINRKPTPGSTSFPVGTIIVKEVNGGDLTTHKILRWKSAGATSTRKAP